jgi:FAD-dependent oxidoreductase domain-containing protein 1
VIAGGGVVGCATAWHLLEAEPGLSVALVEPSLGYELAASSKASGGVRQLFTRSENVLMSRYTHEIIDGWSSWTASNGCLREGDFPDLGWRPQGYLFITHPELSRRLEMDYENQLALGVEALWLEPEEVGERYRQIRTDDLGPAILSPRDGWLDPHAFLRGMLSRARGLGAEMVTDRVIGFSTEGRRVVAAELESGARIGADHFVNVAGVWGPGLSAGLGLRLPVEPMRRFDHYVKCRADFSGYPFIKDPAGLAVRPEGGGLTAALVDFSTPGGFDLTIDNSYFEKVVWPSLATRIPEADELRLVSTWSGLDDQNRLDGNMILDRWTGHLDNFLFATGFSGHGLMHAPAVGRALTELLLHGGFQTLDLSAMGLRRVYDDAPYPELTIR